MHRNLAGQCRSERGSRRARALGLGVLGACWLAFLPSGLDLYAANRLQPEAGGPRQEAPVPQQEDGAAHDDAAPSRELLEKLAARFKLGIVTGRPRADAERFLHDRCARGLFAAVVCREDAPLKPDPAPVRLALEQLDARTAWMLGDTPDDLRAAAGAGVAPVGVVPPGGGETVWAALEEAGAARIVEADTDFGGLFNG